MENHPLKYDVHSIDGELLLPAGSVADQATLIDLTRRHGGNGHQSYSFSELGGPQADLKSFMAEPPYNTIFTDPSETRELLLLMGKIEMLSPVIDSLDYFREKDFHTYRHSMMVFALSTLLIRHMYPDDHHLTLLGSLAGPSHDLGKTCVPPDILQKQTPLTRPELEILKHHVLAGYVQLSLYTGDSDHLSAHIARDHHERRDGSGYPRGTDVFNEMVEIIILTDIYDALISPRPYRPVAYDNRSALEELTRMAEEGQIGWMALKTLISFNRRNRPNYQECDISSERRAIPPDNNIYGMIAEENDKKSTTTEN